MALQAAYKQFLAAPSSSALAENASLHYVTTTSSFAGATEIIKHLASVRNKIKKQKEDALFAVEDQHALAIELDTTLEFVSSGGPYLPGLDDNFLADRTVHLAVTHVVTFNGEGKITAIRQSWDQGALLKQVEVIGRTGQNWPIRDSKAQISLIAKCVAGDGTGVAPTEALPTRSRSSTNAMRDPHASLDLFAPRDELESIPAAVISPYAGRRPRQRSFTEILGDEPVEEPGSPSNGRERSQSPSKAVAPKVGAGKNFQPMRLFDMDENDLAAETHEPKPSTERLMRVDPKKYQHFDFDDGSETPAAAAAPAPKPAPDRKSKHESNWSFEDFVTPVKPVASRGIHRARDVRHWGADNEVLENTPAPRPAVSKPRRDAEAHFELVDDGPESEGPRHAGRPPRGAQHNEGLHLYDNRLHVEEGTVPSPEPPALGNITNLKDRGRDFEAHFNFTDESPHHAGANDPPPKVSEDRKKAVRMMESNWAPYDESPASRKENDDPNHHPKRAADDHRGIAIAGDGMGGKKGSARGWLAGDADDADQLPVPARKGGRGPPAKSDNFWDF
ncbi:uncharacterized protein THITE_2121683 [Thermothielavioides terrestris NRRL 8126]|uniref:NTF2 domain-containing protein n=1 Tax=Thermothielavioides terrestris (strain ATCC 38088 / NRRL 8126) TaxID=578455 RepID=G2RF72_THETT|nr:uncharacterized protein THITE_2121683 [Thermothielavioides terrestris NRRL 8126]AEO70355.1 hypothetical protein THITE_2121683 [Thermothielavioides terrestris NRRL 8126]